MKMALTLFLASSVGGFVAWLLIQIAKASAQSFDWPTFKRWFYTIALMAIFFYAARALRAVARFFEAKTKQEERK
jgi:Kef-type K+ transport system membrane component KefB